MGTPPRWAMGEASSMVSWRVSPPYVFSSESVLPSSSIFLISPPLKSKATKDLRSPHPTSQADLATASPFLTSGADPMTPSQVSS